ncbi:Rib/alpha-like domain-containing protein [Peptoniphilus equinus]|uniref:Rib/alpha-like domain-containing protein n=1 Tax=Peptoniphilus equinus TaxID=3016343 RepID=A0ABY7QRA7_9FIRM|nr:Rib/alpha-like domain-containing protein [Peptoniphilus equinus]WBW49325.1 Rib/alpha-like domain-containing protein [Peptoniphilus equinus]
MENRKNFIRKTAVTLALAQVISVGTPWNSIANFSKIDNKVYAASTMHKWRKFKVNQKTVQKYREVTFPVEFGKKYVENEMVYTNTPEAYIASTKKYTFDENTGKFHVNKADLYEPKLEEALNNKTILSSADTYGGFVIPQDYWSGLRSANLDNMVLADGFDDRASTPEDEIVMDYISNITVVDMGPTKLKDVPYRGPFIDPGPTGSISPNDTVRYYIKIVSKKEAAPYNVVEKSKGDFVEDVTSSNASAYPQSGEQDGFWYEYAGSEVIQNQADTFTPQLTPISVRKGDSVDIVKAITNVPEDAQAEVKTAVDTETPGEKTGVVTITFADTSTKDINVTITVTDWTAMEEIVPIQPIDEKDIVKEEIKVGGTIDLTDNIKNLPETAQVNDVTSPSIDTSKSQETTGTVKITYENGSSIIVTVPVSVINLEADTFTPQLTPISVRKGDGVDIIKAITNVPEDAQAEVKTTVDTETPGEKTGVVTITFSDTSTKDINVTVNVTDWTAMEEIVPIENIIDTIKEEVVAKGENYNVTDNIVAENAKAFEEVGTIDTSKAGQYLAKVKVIFSDGSSRVVNVPVIVLENTDDLEEQIAELKKQINDLQKDLEDAYNTANAEKEALEKQIEEKEKELEDLKTSTDFEKQELQDMIKSLQDKIKSLEDQIAELEDEINQYKEIRDALEIEKQSLEDEIDDLNERIKELEASGGDNEEIIAELQARIEELEVENAMKQDEIDNLENQIFKLEDQLQDALYEKEALENEIADLEEQLKSAEDDNQAKAERIAELEREIELLKEQAQSEDDAKIDEILAKIEELQKQLDEATKAREEAETDTPQEDPNQGLKDKLADLIDEAEREVKRNKDITKDDKRTIEDAIDNGNDTLTDPNADRGDYRDAIRDLEDALEEAKDNAKAEVDKDKLKDAIRDAEKIDLDKLSDRDSRNMNDAIKDAKQVYDAKDSTQKEVDKATDKLKDLMKRLDKNYPNTALDKTSDINKMLASGDKSLSDFIERVRNLLKGDLLTKETISHDKDYTSLKYVFMIDSPKYAEATNKDTLIYQMDVRPFIQNNRTMLPLRYVAYTLGADVTWNDSTRTATFTKNNLTATIQIDHPNTITVNGRYIQMDAPIVMNNDRIFVSLTNISRIFNISNGDVSDRRDDDIEWNSSDNTATIYIAR